MIFVFRTLFLSACFIAALFFLLSLFRGKRTITRRPRRALDDDDS